MPGPRRIYNLGDVPADAGFVDPHRFGEDTLRADAEQNMTNREGFMRYLAMILLLCGLAACGSKHIPGPREGLNQPTLVETGREWSPGEEEILFRVSDGKELAGRRWSTGAGPVGKVVVAVHGVGFYSAVYRDAGKLFSGKGIPFLAYDLRGHGYSARKGELGDLAELDINKQDLREVISATRQTYPGARIYVIGTSLGAVISTLLFTDEGMAPEVSGLTLISPVWLRADLLSRKAQFELWLLKTSSRIFGELKRGKSECVATTTDDKDNIKCWMDDPLVLKELSLNYLKQSLDLSAKAAEAVLAKGFKVPNLILVGGCDTLVVPDMAYDTLSTLLKDAKGESPRFAYYRCGHHALLTGLNRNAVAGDILAWMETPTAPLPSKADDHAMENYGATEARYAGRAKCCVNYEGKRPSDCFGASD